MSKKQDEQRKDAAKKGGESHSKEHMSGIGKKGGESRGKSGGQGGSGR